MIANNGLKRIKEIVMEDGTKVIPRPVILRVDGNLLGFQRAFGVEIAIDPKEFIKMIEEE